MEEAYDLDHVFRLVHAVGKEMAGRPPGLADVKQPAFGRQSFAVMAKPGIALEVPTRFGDQSAVFEELALAERLRGVQECLADIRLRRARKDEAHEKLLPERFRNAVVEERFELFVGFELRTVAA